MQLELIINFEGNCREAVDFYAKVFHSEVKNVMTYGQAPAHPDYPVAEADMNKILYCDIQIGGITVMCMDMPTGYPLILGNNINPTVSMTNKEEVERVFNELSEGGEVFMELQQTFFSELYGMLKDPFGVIWQVLYYNREG